MTDEEQTEADLAPGEHDIPEDVANRLTFKAEAPPDDGFDKSQAFLHGQGSDEQTHLKSVQDSEDRIKKWVSTFHGPEPENLESLRTQAASGKITGSDYFAMTGRIFAGGTGDVAQRDAEGRITGYRAPEGGRPSGGGPSGTPGLDAFHAGTFGSPLGGPSTTPGLDAFHTANPQAPSNPGFSFLPNNPTPLPPSISSAVGKRAAAPVGIVPKRSQTVLPLTS